MNASFPKKRPQREGKAEAALIQAGDGGVFNFMYFDPERNPDFRVMSLR
jgi:hypothetical protein